MKSTVSPEALPSSSRRTEKPVKRLPSWSVPSLILLGFAILFLVLFGDRILPAPEVDVAIVLAAPATGQAAPIPGFPAATEGKPLFQASGWIEPAPLPIKATALIDGVVETVHVLQGQTVKKGELLASLIAEDERLSLAISEQNHRMAESAYAAHQSAIHVADKKVAGLEAQLAAAATLRDEAADRLKRIDQLPEGAVSQADAIAAKLRQEREASQYLVALSAVDEMKAEVERLKAEGRIRKDEIEAAALGVEKSRLAHSRTKITSPTDGRVVRLLAAPGQKKLLQADDPESATIAILYRPGEIQVRVDVPLADASGLQIGQHARIRCSLLPEKTFYGKVTLISGEADLQRNTLQAKVSIDDPVDELRPEMLCRVEFLGTRVEGAAASAPPAGSLATWIPEAALAQNHVWVCDSESRRVSKRTVTPATEKMDGYIRISDGLRPGEWVVLSPGQLEEGNRVIPNLVEQ